MKAEVEIKRRITITLDEDEAIWLKDFIQSSPDREHEPVEERAIRCVLFQDLRRALEEV
jgi:hypothetical protein